MDFNIVNLKIIALNYIIIMSSIISEKNKCILKIKEIENIINRYEETIKRLRNQQMSNEFIKSQILVKLNS
jgi:hypothetical protein